MTLSAALPPVTHGLPILARGHHTHPDEGACLLEYTSVLAGGSFSDHPRCTAPVLATLGRLVNDAMSEDKRQELTRLAPDLAARPQVTAGATASLVAGVLSDVAAAVDAGCDRRCRRTARWLRTNAEWESRRARAASRKRSAWLVGLTAVAHRSGAARLRLEYAVRASTCLDPHDRDRLLLRILQTAVASVPARPAAVGSTMTEAVPDRGRPQPPRTWAVGPRHPSSRMSPTKEAAPSGLP
jgi:hypothetical protein